MRDTKQAIDSAQESDCAWCGADVRAEIAAGTTPRVFVNRCGERFCSKSHRDASNAALRRLLNSNR